MGISKAHTFQFDSPNHKTVFFIWPLAHYNRGLATMSPQRVLWGKEERYGIRVWVCESFPGLLLWLRDRHSCSYDNWSALGGGGEGFLTLALVDFPFLALSDLSVTFSEQKELSMAVVLKSVWELGWIYKIAHGMLGQKWTPQELSSPLQMKKLKLREVVFYWVSQPVSGRTQRKARVFILPPSPEQFDAHFTRKNWSHFLGLFSDTHTHINILFMTLKYSTWPLEIILQSPNWTVSSSSILSLGLQGHISILLQIEH